MAKQGKACFYATGGYEGIIVLVPADKNPVAEIVGKESDYHLPLRAVVILDETTTPTWEELVSKGSYCLWDW